MKIEASWTRTIAPVQEPITLADAKAHARITQTQDDALISTYIKTAREEAEKYMGRGLFTQTWALSTSEFTDVIYLPMAAPLQSVTSVQYYDSTGTLQTLATSVYDVDTASRPGRVVLKPGQSWPSVQWTRIAPRVVITYVVGWSAITSIPERIKHGLRMYVAYLDCNRDGFEDRAEYALCAAQSCWDDRVTWIEPKHWCYAEDGYWR